MAASISLISERMHPSTFTSTMLPSLSMGKQNRASGRNRRPAAKTFPVRSVGTKKSLFVFLMYELMLQPLSDRIIKTGQPTAPRKESWGSRKAPIYRKKRPEKNSERFVAGPGTGEGIASPLLLLCLCFEAEDAKKRQKAKLSDAL